MVVQGRIARTIGTHVLALNEGDRVSLLSPLPHRTVNPSDQETVVLRANTPITLRP